MLVEHQAMITNTIVVITVSVVSSLFGVLLYLIVNKVDKKDFESYKSSSDDYKKQHFTEHRYLIESIEKIDEKTSNKLDKINETLQGILLHLAKGK